MKRMFVINDADTVLTNKSIRETIEWYEKDYDEVDSIEEVKYSTINTKGFWDEDVPDDLKELFYDMNKTISCENNSHIDKLEIVRENDNSIMIGYFKGELCIWRTFKEEMENYNGDEPYIICSTEY